MSERTEESILRVEGLKKYYDTSSGFIDSLLGRGRSVKAVDDVDLELREGETLGVVGESGCGKTTLGRSILRLIKPTDGTVYYRDEELTAVSNVRLRRLKKDLQYIFQDPFASLNPRLTVGDIIGEPLDVHDLADGEERTERIGELLETVGLNASHTRRYPHEFSGGQRQRIGIARALAVDPEVIVCDEPVSALDVSVQAQILNLLEDLQDEFGLSYIFIAHDLSVVEHISDRVAVMYLGEIAEVGTTEEVFSPPHHPYTEALLSAIPEPDPLWEDEQITLPGTVPSPIDPPSGCRFHTRCPRIIQPDDYELTQAEWRSIVDLKLQTGDAESVGSLATTEEESVELSSLTRDRLDELIRSEYSLPRRVSDEQAEEVLSSAIDRLHAGEIADANERLDSAFVSPCERRPPDQYRTGDAHRIACFLYEEENDEHDSAGRADAVVED